MIETVPDVESLEARLTELRTLHDELTTTIAAADIELTAADKAVAAAQAVFDEVVRAKAPPADRNAFETWTDDPRRDEEVRERLQRAEGLFEQADRELGMALVARTTISQARGFTLLRLRQAETEIARAEADLEAARQAPARERDLLASIRARILGGPA